MNNAPKKITILDSTLRDGAQGEGISFSVQDKINIVKILDDLGVSYIEAGNPGSNPKDLEFFQKIKKIQLNNAKIAAFGATRRKGITCKEDTQIQSLISADTEIVVIFGKSWDFQVTEILQTTLEENLAMISDTVSYLKAANRRVIYDAEHFFDAWKSNKDYTLKTIEAAVSAGAEVVALCDTKGGSLPLEVYEITKEVTEKFAGKTEIGIHCHNDMGLAVATSLMSVEGGATHIQGTLVGFGERTGNANLSTIIANLELKMQIPCLPEDKLSLLTLAARQVAEIANVNLDQGMPYVGGNAFAHKAGMHIDAVNKNPTAYEHISPEQVGNDRVFLMSEVAGRSTIIKKINRFDPTITKDNPVVNEIIKKMKEMEHAGYQFEGADGSFELLIRKNLGKYKPFFKLHYYKTIGEKPPLDETLCSFAQLKIEVDEQIEITAGEGDGPVHALDKALRKALERFYPAVSQIRLTDYKVRVLDSKSTTASKVRVLIESSDGINSWTTVGVSADILEASWLALVDSFEYKLIRDIERQFKAYL
ncbi:MAG: citramalate synthase [Spirochaetaceae bacterium]|nr:citramalate synthase [Spirochaetaceae bacterium]